ncbi:MAG: SDR family oxidoreductase [Candidatus Woesebacteria bacterium]|jgi:NAD(P)-dependent dehydrogenase (short-subunit alcohol dehydrogenase family)
MKYNYHNKTVIITGASKGIGLATAKKFIAAGATVFNISRTKAKNFQDDRFNNVLVDIQNIDQVKHFLDKFTQSSAIDILINNAGIYPQAKLADVKEKDWDRTFETNLKSLFFISQFVAKKMKKNKGGVILNAASFAAKIPSIGSGVYAASKAAIVSLTKSMAAEWAKDNIRVNSYSPGLILTDMTKDIIKKYQDKVIEPIALKKYGKNTDIAKALLFLCSEDASYITGINLEIDGGKFLVQNQQNA